MANMNYHKVYMNQIHSSNLLCELAQMWKSQSLCDAVIKTGTVTTKAHRLVLVAACPMLKSMENASVGSHLEVRLASDIKQDSVNTFLQYLYEGVMMLTEENFKDIEKIARILQVDSVIKCCADFYKCLHSKSQYKYDYNDHIEFKHVRQTDLLKNSDRVTKRNLDSTQPSSPGGKRQRMQMSKGAGGDVSILGVSHKADDRISMAHSYMSNDPPFRTHRMGPASVSRVKSNVVDVVEDSVEIVHTEKDPGGSKRPAIDTNSALSISVASQITSGAEVQVVNVSSNGNNATTTTTSSASSEPKSTATQDSSTSKVPVRPQLAGPFTSDKPPDPVSTSTPLRIQKSFAAGSAMQAAAAAFSSTTPCSSPSANQVTGGQEMSKESSSKSTPEPPRCSSADLSPDLSIVKKEQVGLDMHVDIQQEPGEEASSDVEFEESSQEEGNMSLDQAAMNWYQGQAFKGFGEISYSNPSASSVSKLLGEMVDLHQTFESHPETVPNSGPYPVNQFVNMSSVNLRNSTGYDSKATGKSNNKYSSDSGIPHKISEAMCSATKVASQDNFRSLKYTKVSDDNLYIMESKIPGVHNTNRSFSGSFNVSDSSNVSQMSGVSGATFTASGPPRHRLVSNPGKKARHCEYCKITGSKTECGWGIKCYYRCEACDVALCNMKRDCFNLYHEQLKQTTNPEIQWDRNQVLMPNYITTSQ